ncbi:major facilitator superfamily domain-containing protein [Cercophora scortea]|uniref:Major facilitator superfamily domain-containing protein n=1 Tax=Cercophora scortea TaxID=314031 RepID=A0AAE0M2V3_9PEZI|nr:major facilitator superfamily domain-containing protein [Cercophora scortea]
MASTTPTPEAPALEAPYYITGMSTTTTPAMSAAPTFEKSGDDSDLEKTGQQTPASILSSSASTSTPTGTRTIRGLSWILVCISLYISAFLYGLDTTIAADVQGPVVEQFGHADQLSWIGSGFPLGSVAVILFVGNLYGHFNMKWIFIVSTALFEVGSVLCGAAPNMDALIVGRVLAGSGGAGMYLGCLNYFTLLTAPEERGLYISLTGFFWGIGAVLGPVIGGAFSVSSATWRWAFYINLVIGAAAAPVYVYFLPALHSSGMEGKTVRERIVHFDFLGLVLIAATWVTFTVGFSMAGGSWAWNSPQTIAVLVIFGVVLIAAVVQQYFTILTTAETRAFPGHLLLSRTQILLLVSTACSTTSLFVVTYYIPIYFQFVHSDSAIQAAVRLMPFIIITVVTNVVAGHLLSRIRYYMPMYLTAGIFITLGGALLTAYLDTATSEGAIYGFTVITAVGTGLTLQLGYAVATLTVSSDDAGNAINLQNVAQIGSTAICLVIAGQVFNSAAVSNLAAVLAGQGFTAQQIADAVTGAQSEVFQLLSGDLRVAAVEAIVKAMQKAFILVAVAGGTMVVAAAGMKRERLFGEIVTA